MGFFDRFKKNKKEKIADNMYLYSEKELDEYETFIQQNFGSYENVFHEIVSPDVHLDVIMIPPTPEKPFHKLITMGMGAYAMNIPDNLKKYGLEHAELVCYLPKDWNITSPEEKDYWPLRYLKILGRLPVEHNTWLGYGHTVHANAEAEPFAENTKLNSILLLNALNLEFEDLNLQLSSGKKINFYQMFPLYQEELEFKQQHSAEELLDLFSDEDIMPILNIDRKNYGKV